MNCYCCCSISVFLLVIVNEIEVDILVIYPKRRGQNCICSDQLIPAMIVFCSHKSVKGGSICNHHPAFHCIAAVSLTLSSALILLLLPLPLLTSCNETFINFRCRNGYNVSYNSQPTTPSTVRILSIVRKQYGFNSITPVPPI